MFFFSFFLKIIHFGYQPVLEISVLADAVYAFI